MHLSCKNVTDSHPPAIELNAESVTIAYEAMEHLWRERCGERGREYEGERSGSCKFAALLARALFGGRLAGNLDHVFVVLPGEGILDLNVGQPDVEALGAKALERHDFILLGAEYRKSLKSCMPRVLRWAEWAQLAYSMHLGRSAESPNPPVVAALLRHRP